MSKKIVIILCVLFCVFAGQAIARENLALKLQKPIRCTLEKDCWIVNYVDIDPAENVAHDYQCGSRSYDEHMGTDFGLVDWKSMEQGVDVLSAADGVILRVRDEIPDRILNAEEIKAIKAQNKGCGNGVVIDHGKNLTTIYCHMKQGSVVVKSGQKIKAGEKVGEVGHSGSTEFPHLHFGVFSGGSPVEPFLGVALDMSKKDGALNNGCAGPSLESLWKDALPYEPFSLYEAGFLQKVPDFEEIKKDATSPQVLSSQEAEALVFWAGSYGLVIGDKVTIEILDTENKVFSSREIVQDRNRARQFYYVGKKVKAGSLKPGHYIGRQTVRRMKADGTEVSRFIERLLVVKP